MGFDFFLLGLGLISCWMAVTTFNAIGALLVWCTIVCELLFILYPLAALLFFYGIWLIKMGLEES